ncbi:hypothetical protein [Xanthomonas phaseoli]|uniref:hypothetical protein n=1 Tax=Xanthomonas phaseoli TaxID=1985254 RepID=UPI000306C7E8|nr:hypothetical protein [Xanthomonas phaseoli]
MDDARLEAIRTEVARRHKVLLGDNDPILVTATLNELLLRGHLDELQKHLERCQDETTSGLQQLLEESREIAGNLVTGAAQYLTAQLRQAAEPTAEATAAKLDQLLGAKLQRYENAATRAEAAAAHVRATVYLAGGLAVLGLGGLLAAVLMQITK